VITSRRDYILRIIDEVSRLVARLVFKRSTGSDQEALELAVQGFERLFNLDRHHLFQFTPDQQFVMLTLDEPPEIARDKVLLYAALSDEAGRTYTKMGNEKMATATYANALKFSLKARTIATDAPLPAFAPKIEELVALVGDDRLDDETRQLLAR
jgi:hypothetical protein